MFSLFLPYPLTKNTVPKWLIFRPFVVVGFSCGLVGVFLWSSCGLVVIQQMPQKSPHHLPFFPFFLKKSARRAEGVFSFFTLFPAFLRGKESYKRCPNKPKQAQSGPNEPNSAQTDTVCGCTVFFNRNPFYIWVTAYSRIPVSGE